MLPGPQRRAPFSAGKWPFCHCFQYTDFCIIYISSNFFLKKEDPKFVLDKITKKGSELHEVTPQAAAGAQAETRMSSSEESLRKPETSHLGFKRRKQGREGGKQEDMTSDRSKTTAPGRTLFDVAPKTCVP